MSIKQYIDENGLQLFQVRVDLRSRYNRNLRVMRKTMGLQTAEEAKREEKRLRRSCADLIHERETRGATLSFIIRRWTRHAKRTRVQTGEVGDKFINDCQGTLRKWLQPYLGQPAYHLGDYALTEIMRKMRTKGISQNQLIKFQRMVRVVFEYGIAKSFLAGGTKIPSGELSLKVGSEKIPEILTHDEIKKLMEEAMLRQHPWRHVWAFALLTGMRSGELQALVWSDIDLTNKIIRVSKSCQAVTGIIKSTKAGYWRDVPISEELTRVIAELRSHNSATTFVLPRFDEWISGGQAAVLRRFCTEIGLASIRFHTLRACFATQLLRNGVESVKVMKVCGWRDLSTMQRYVRLAGIEIMGVTESLSVLPPLNFSAKVVSLHGA